MRGNIAQMMQQAQRMQENLKRAQEELAQLEVTGNAGGGMVTITITGKMETRKVRIDPSALADGEMLEDLVAAASTTRSTRPTPRARSAWPRRRPACRCRRA
jgi:DNA-binding YbaB/EbfC family protein